MPSLFDMLTNAQNGNGMEALSRQYGLSQQQTQSAVEALLPALSQGLKRNASDPYGVGAFLSALSTGRHAKYFDDANQAFSPQGVQEGNGILGHLFGSKELSRAVASQAAQATGIGEATLKQMLPALATMIMGGLFKQTTGQQQAAAGFGGQGNPLGEILEQMMRQAGGGAAGNARAPQPQAPQPGANPADNPFGKILQDMFGGGQQTSRAPQAPQSPYGDNPLGKIFEEMTRGSQQQASPQPRTAPSQQPQANPSGRERNPYDDLFGQMFETGRQQRDDYQKNMESVVDQFLKGMDRYRR
ncbi:DUF937 domain-containing protein [Aquamicrobium sp. LC103]|uniref:DUF937 domain-containing protein n=1 Tax=Aquamicrobium sp. LC103 TaxID=1120658 RepID=UPI00063EA929|nr:DUF937 domain-containing protein [Aquamicrobium sp. LC103]TKT74125.1 DUF937 domain-containing protein [Aquamicrobium sp. LC103]